MVITSMEDAKKEPPLALIGLKGWFLFSFIFNPELWFDYAIPYALERSLSLQRSLWRPAAQ